LFGVFLTSKFESVIGNIVKNACLGGLVICLLWATVAAGSHRLVTLSNPGSIPG